MPTGLEIKSSLDALDVSLKAKNIELNGQILEKTNLQSEIENIENVILPKLRAEKSAEEATHTENLANHKTNVDNAYKTAYSTTPNSAQSIYNTRTKLRDWAITSSQSKVSATQSALDVWTERRDVKCSRAKNGYYDGTYCGRRNKAGCMYGGAGNYEADARSTCIKEDYRNMRYNYAVGKVNEFSKAIVDRKAEHKFLIDNPSLAFKNAKTNLDTAKANHLALKSLVCCKTSQTAINDKTFEIAGYKKKGGTIDVKTQRIAYLDALIEKTNKVIVSIDREKYLASQKYQVFVNKTKTQNAIVNNAEKEQEAIRKAESLLLDESIKENAEELKRTANPEYRAEIAKKESENKMFILGGIAILVAGIYVIKNK